MWSAFVTGMAEKATSLIDERDKEIQEKIDKQLEKMYQDAAVTKKKAELRRDTLESTARELMTLGVSQEQAATLLQNVGPEGAANMVERLKSAKQVTPEKIRAALSQVKTSKAPLDEVIARQTTPTATEVQAPQMRGAFGLPSRAGKEFAETARGIETELPAIPTTAQPLDLSVFEDAEEEDTPTIKQLQGMLADQAVKNNMSVDDFIKNTDDGASLAARIAGRRLQGGDEEDKARTASQIRTLVNSRLQEEIAPLQFKSITYDPNLQDFVVTIPGSPEAIQFLEKRRNVAADVFKNAGLLKGNRLSDRNAADAISPFAVVDYKTLTIKSWRPVAGSTGGAGAPAAGEQPAAPAPTPSPARRPADVPAGVKPIPRDADGKVDKSQLVAGEKYASSTGDVRIWNGTTFQPAK
jgi:predicted Holliday junction resolvase-like endonuclease